MGFKVSTIIIDSKNHCIACILYCIGSRIKFTFKMNLVPIARFAATFLKDYHSSIRLSLSPQLHTAPNNNFKPVMMEDWEKGRTFYTFLNIYYIIAFCVYCIVSWIKPTKNKSCYNYLLQLWLPLPPQAAPPTSNESGPRPRLQINIAFYQGYAFGINPRPK